MSIRLVSEPSKRMTIGSATRVALYEDALKAKLRFSIPTINAEAVRWYQVASTQLVPNAWRMIIRFCHIVEIVGRCPVRKFLEPSSN